MVRFKLPKSLPLASTVAMVAAMSVVAPPTFTSAVPPEVSEVTTVLVSLNLPEFALNPPLPPWALPKPPGEDV